MQGVRCNYNKMRSSLFLNCRNRSCYIKTIRKSGSWIGFFLPPKNQMYKTFDRNRYSKHKTLMVKTELLIFSSFRLRMVLSLAVRFGGMQLPLPRTQLELLMPGVETKSDSLSASVFPKMNFKTIFHLIFSEIVFWISIIHPYTCKYYQVLYIIFTNPTQFFLY